MDKLNKLSEVLSKRGFDIEIFQSSEKAAERIYEMVKGATVGLGSSMTLEKSGLLKNIDSSAKNVFRHSPGIAGQDERNALTSDFYLTSANAVSMDGHMVNIDGTGNRVAATCFGPKRVVYLVGKNKITETLDKALQRAKITAVKLASYFNRKTPCVKTGKCEDCLSLECVCSITVIHRKKPNGLKMSVFLINEDIGL